MTLTRDDMLRELELLPVWRAKYIEPPAEAVALPVNVVEATSVIMPQETVAIEAREIEVLATENVAETSHVSTAKTIGDSCVVCPLMSLANTAEATPACLLIAYSPNAATITAAELFAGEQGELLNNMLAAIKLKLSTETFMPLNQSPFEQTKVMLVLGGLAAQSLLASDAAIDDLRARLHEVQGHSLIVTYPPSHLLQHPIDKAKAWQDLLLAKKAMADLQS